MYACYQATELSNIKHELVYGQVCLVFMSSTIFEGDQTPQKHTSSMITNKRVQSPPKGKSSIKASFSKKM